MVSMVVCCSLEISWGLQIGGIHMLTKYGRVHLDTVSLLRHMKYSGSRTLMTTSINTNPTLNLIWSLIPTTKLIFFLAVNNSFWKCFESCQAESISDSTKPRTSCNKLLQPRQMRPVFVLKSVYYSAMTGQDTLLIPKSEERARFGNSAKIPAEPLRRIRQIEEELAGTEMDHDEILVRLEHGKTNGEAIQKTTMAFTEIIGLNSAVNADLFPRWCEVVSIEVW